MARAMREGYKDAGRACPVAASPSTKAITVPLRREYEIARSVALGRSVAEAVLAASGRSSASSDDALDAQLLLCSLRDLHEPPTQPLVGTMAAWLIAPPG